MDEPESPPRVALTGATGFIGRHLQDALTREGFAVRALVRPRSRHRNHLRDTVEVVEGALTDAAAARTLVADTDAVVYCAGAVRGRRARDFATANVAGVRCVARAAAAAPAPPRFLLLSSLAASRPEISHYAASKRAGERELTGIAALRWTVLRPPAVYGPGDREMLPLLRAVWRGWVPMVGGPDQRLSLLHATDLAAAVLAWLRDADSRCDGATYAIDDGRPSGYRWADIAAAAPRAHAVRFRVPRALLFTVAAANDGLAALLRYDPMLTPGKARELCQRTWLCDNAAFSAATAWQPQIRLEAGMAALFGR